MCNYFCLVNIFVAISDCCVLYSHMQPPQTVELVVSSTHLQAPVIVSSSGQPVMSSTQYVYRPGPRDEPRRRFTEEKPDSKVPEGLLGYEVRYLCKEFHGIPAKDFFIGSI